MACSFSFCDDKTTSNVKWQFLPYFFSRWRERLDDNDDNEKNGKRGNNCDEIKMRTVISSSPRPYRFDNINFNDLNFSLHSSLSQSLIHINYARLWLIIQMNFFLAETITFALVWRSFVADHRWWWRGEVNIRAQPACAHCQALLDGWSERKKIIHKNSN